MTESLGIVTPLPAARGDLVRDLVAGATVGASQVGNAMAYTMLAGVPPVHGLYAVTAGTPVAALGGGSRRMVVVPTAALCLAAGEALAALPPDRRVAGFVTLALLTGTIMLLAGVVRAGSLLRFVSNAVMIGFMAGVATQIILGQTIVLTGFSSPHAGKIAQTADLVLHPTAADPATTLVGAATIILVVLLSRTRLRLFAMAVALVAVTAAVALLGLTSVAVIADISSVPRGLPAPRLPDLGLAAQVLLPALSLAIIGLVQGAGISRAMGALGDARGRDSRDFLAQGAANVAGSLFGGGPVGGSVQATALNARAGARTRWAAVAAAAVVVLVMVVAAPLIERVPLAVIAGILIVAATGAVDLGAARDVWRADRLSAAVMVVTFALVLVVPLQYAIFAGVVLSVVKYVYLASLEVRVVEVCRARGGGLCEREVPGVLHAGEVTVLDVYGSLFFAAGPKLRASLPAARGVRRAVVVLRLRGRGTLQGSTIALLRDYAAELGDGGGRLYLAGVGAEMAEQLSRTGLAGRLGADAIVPATETLYDACEVARSRGEAWLAAAPGRDGAASATGEA